MDVVLETNKVDISLYREREVMITWDKGEPIPKFEPATSLDEGILDG